MSRFYSIVFSFSFFSFFFFLSSCNSLKFEAVASKEDRLQEWRTEGGSNARTYHKVTEIPLQFPLKEVKQFNAQAGFGRDVMRMIGRNVVIATMKGEVYAWDANTQKKLGFVNLGEGIDGGFVVHENLLIVPHASGKRSLSAYHFERGAKAWIAKGESVSSGLLLHQNRVIYADSKGNVVAVNVIDGTTIWKNRIQETVSAILASPVADAKNVFIIDEYGKLAAFDLEKGEKVLEMALQMPIQNTPVWDEEAQRLYVPTTRGELLVVKPYQKQIEKRFELQESEVRLATPALSETMLVIGSSNGDVSGVDKETGSIRWQLHTDGAFVAPPLIVGEVALIGGLDKTIYALHIQEGNMIWDKALKGRIKSVPMVHQNYVFVLSEPNLVYIFKTADK